MISSIEAWIASLLASSFLSDPPEPRSPWSVMPFVDPFLANGSARESGSLDNPGFQDRSIPIVTFHSGSTGNSKDAVDWEEIWGLGGRTRLGN